MSKIKRSLNNSGELPLEEKAITVELIEFDKEVDRINVDMAEAEKEREAINKEWSELNEMDQALAWHEENKAQTEVLMAEIVRGLN